MDNSMNIQQIDRLETLEYMFLNGIDFMQDTEKEELISLLLHRKAELLERIEHMRDRYNHTDEDEDDEDEDVPQNDTSSEYYNEDYRNRREDMD